MKLQYEDIQFLINILRKLDNEEASTLLSIIIMLFESNNINKLQI